MDFELLTTGIFASLLGSYIYSQGKKTTTLLNRMETCGLGLTIAGIVIIFVAFYRWLN